MKYMAPSLVIAVLTVNLCFAEIPPVHNLAPEKEGDRISYSLGFQIGGDMKKQALEIDEVSMLKGIEEGLAGTEPVIPHEEMRKLLLDLKHKLMAQRKEDLVNRKKEKKELKEKYIGEGRDFLAANAKNKGVTELPSGLQYTVLREGSGRTPGPNDSVTVHYRGTLIDGTEFGSSYHDNKPGEFRVDGVINGWAEALQLMKEGAKWRIFIPADLAYRERGPLADRTVIYEIELISVKAGG